MYKSPMDATDIDVSVYLCICVSVSVSTSLCVCVRASLMHATYIDIFLNFLKYERAHLCMRQKSHMYAVKQPYNGFFGTFMLYTTLISSFRLILRLTLRRCEAYITYILKNAQLYGCFPAYIGLFCHIHRWALSYFKKSNQECRRWESCVPYVSKKPQYRAF